MADQPIAYRINRLHDHVPWSRSKTYELVRDGRLRAKRLDGATFVMREELERFLKELPFAVDPYQPSAGDLVGTLIEF
jgi:uncharacterized protein (UPF0216 family)